MNTVPASLWTSAPFDALDDDARQRLLDACERVAVADGNAVYNAGDTATGLYILVDGAVRLQDPLLTSLDTDHGSGDASERFDAPGTIISKGSVLEPFSHRHHLYADGDATLLTLDRARFDALFEAGDTIAFRLLDFLVRDISADVRGLNHAIQELLAES